jgi:hypothetical protein
MRSPSVYGDPPGEDRMEVNGVVFKKNQKVRLSPANDGTSDIADSLLIEKVATVETIYIDYEDNVHLAVTVDDDPGQDMKRELGLYMYFSPDEVEVIEDE